MSEPRDANVPTPGAPFFTPHQINVAGRAKVPQSTGKSIPALFQPIKIRGLEFHNRIFLSPMSQYSAEDGIATPWHLVNLGGIITRGPGFTCFEATAVLPEGRITPEDAGIWSDVHIEPLSRITEFAHSQSQKIGIELAHAGRKGSIVAPWVTAYPPIALDNPRERGWPDNVWGPSTLPFSEHFPTPKALTREGIKKVVDAFKDAAVRAIKAGFDVIHIHAAHGYLLSSFLTPTSNTRTDEYGGSFENRIRFLLEVVDAIRNVIPDSMPLFIRISGTEWLEEAAPDEPQWRVEDTVRLVHLLADHGVDLVDVSSGGMDARQRIIPGEGYQAHLAAAVKKSVGNKVVISTVGALGSAHVAQRVIEDGWTDVVVIGRQFLKNPGLVWTMAEELGVEIHISKQIGWGFQRRWKQVLGYGGKPSDEA